MATESNHKKVNIVNYPPPITLDIDLWSNSMRKEEILGAVLIATESDANIGSIANTAKYNRGSGPPAAKRRANPFSKQK